MFLHIVFATTNFGRLTCLVKSRDLNISTTMALFHSRRIPSLAVFAPPTFNNTLKQLLVFHRTWRWALQALLVPALHAANPIAQILEPDFDFGTIQPTATVRHEYKISNTGDASLEISSVRPGCGCTTVEAWDHHIPPGASGRIAIQFNPANFSGPVRKLVTVETNDPAHPTLFLQFHAVVWAPIDVQPISLWFLPIEGEPGTETKSVEITSNLAKALALAPPHSANPVFKTDLQTIHPGKEFALAVTYAYPGDSPGLQTTIEIPTSAAERPAITVAAIVLPRPALIPLPSIISIPDTPSPAPFKTVLFIRNNGRRSVVLSEPSVNVPGVTARLEENDPGKAFDVTLVVPANFAPPPGQPLFLTIKTTHPRFPTLTVPIIPCKMPAP